MSATETLERQPLMARRAGASLRTLQRLFPAETGLTLEAWRQKARLIWSITRPASLPGLLWAWMASNRLLVRPS